MTRFSWRWIPLLLVAGCSRSTATARANAADSSAVPQQTVVLSQMMRELSAQPGFTEQLLGYINKGQKSGATLTPTLFDVFRKLILGKDWSGLDRFPGWTIASVTRTVNAGEGLIKGGLAKPADAMIHIGPYQLDAPMTESLDAASTRPPFTQNGLVTQLTPEVVNGDGADPRLAPMHAESARLAEIMNRLSLNGFGKSAPFSVTIGNQQAATPEAMVNALIATGHNVVVADSRFFANFGHFHYKGQDVEMPFFLDSQILVPKDHWWQRSRRLLVPVAHAEYEWIISGPTINADVTFYFGIDGRAEFRTNDQLNQTWVMGRHAHEYRGDQAVEVTRLTGKMVRAYAALHAAYPALPFGGYYTLGVCQDVVGAIEMRMTGRTTLFPNTARTELFKAQPDEEITRLMEAVPKDTGGAPPAPERIFGSLPTSDLQSITVPGLRSDLIAVWEAQRQGRLERRHVIGPRDITLGVLGMAAIAIAIALTLRAKRRTT